jgi:cytochrome c2
MKPAAVLCCVWGCLPGAWLTGGGYGAGGQPNTGEFRSTLPGDPGRGAKLIVQYSCSACHTVPGIRRARGRVGPPLDFFAERTYIGGDLPNTPDTLVRWIMDAPGLIPATAMPRLGVSEADARDIAAYLYTLH